MGIGLVNPKSWHLCVTLAFTVIKMITNWFENLVGESIVKYLRPLTSLTMRVVVEILKVQCLMRRASARRGAQSWRGCVAREDPPTGRPMVLRLSQSGSRSWCAMSGRERPQGSQVLGKVGAAGRGLSSALEVGGADGPALKWRQRGPRGIMRAWSPKTFQSSESGSAPRSPEVTYLLETPTADSPRFWRSLHFHTQVVSRTRESSPLRRSRG